MRLWGFEFFSFYEQPIYKFMLLESVINIKIDWLYKIMCIKNDFVLRFLIIDLIEWI